MKKTDVLKGYQESIAKECLLDHYRQIYCYIDKYGFNSLEVVADLMKHIASEMDAKKQEGSDL